MDDPLIKLEDLHTCFFTDDGSVKAVSGVDILIDAGETVGLVGESGCGKSVTALSIMRLIQEPPGKIVKGRILFEGNDLLRLTGDQMRQIRGNRISMIFQEPMTSLNPVLKVGFQIAEVMRLHQGLSKKQAMDRAVEMFAKVGIPDARRRIDEYPHQMSGGMRQRVMIAMALSCNPSLLIADEPTTALDVTIQAQILDLMNELKSDLGTSILLITHDLGVVAEMAQWVAVMYAGKIVEYTEATSLFRNPLHPYTDNLMASIPQVDKPVPESRLLQVIPGMVPNLLKLPQGCAFQDRCEHAFSRCQKEGPPLLTVSENHYVRCFLHENGSAALC